MNFPTHLTRRPSGKRVDILLAKLGVVAAVLLLGLQVFATQVFLFVIPLSIGAGSGLYLLTRGNIRSQVYRPPVSRTVTNMLPGAVILGLAAVVVLIHINGTRTGGVYLITGAIGAGILVQILLMDGDSLAPGPVLFQVLLAGVVLRLTALYATPGYVGVDIWTHTTVFIDGIAREGTLGPLDDSKYLTAPFYHVIGSIGALVLGSVRNGLYLSMGFLVPLAALFVYMTGKLFMPVRWALLASALYVFSDQFIRWGLHIIPTSLGLVFFLAAVYLITRLLYANAESWVVALLLVVSLSVVFTHQVSTAILLTVLAFATLVAGLVALTGANTTPPRGVRKTLALFGVFVTTLTTAIISWSNTPFSEGDVFLWRELAVLQRAIAEASFLSLASSGGTSTPANAGAQSTLGQLVPYIELVGFALLLAAAITGGLMLLRWKVAPDIALTHVITGGGLFVIVFGLSLFGVRALLPGRWMAFLYVSLALLGAVGLYYVSQTRSRHLMIVVVLLFAIGYPTTMVVAEKAALDSPAFADQHKRFAYTESEIGAVETIGAIYPPTAERRIETDHPYVGLFRRLGRYDASVLAIGDGATATDTTVYREYQSSGPVTFRLDSEGAAGSVPASVKTAVCPHSWNKLYANDNVWLCTDPGGISG